MRIALIAAALTLAACSPQSAEPAVGTADHAAAGHGADGAAKAGDAPFAASETAMHAEMAEASGDTIDEAYIAKMIAHHRGAIAMADVALAQSQDPAIRQMAQTVKDTQTVEIAQMQAWTPTTATTPPAAKAAAPVTKSAAPAAKAEAPAATPTPPAT